MWFMSYHYIFLFVQYLIKYKPVNLFLIVVLCPSLKLARLLRVKDSQKFGKLLFFKNSWWIEVMKNHYFFNFRRFDIFKQSLGQGKDKWRDTFTNVWNANTITEYFSTQRKTRICNSYYFVLKKFTLLDWDLTPWHILVW